jgi:uncharacterized protein (TIGR02217 family)
MSELAAFHDVRFPTAISFGATGGPERRTEIVALASGREKRNARASLSRRRYDVGTGVRSLTDLQQIVEFFEARRGPLHAFRFRDPFDMKSCRADLELTATDQTVGSGDGVTLRFGLVKRYGAGDDAYARPIRKPVPGTLAVAIDGSPVPSDAVIFDDATGEVVLTEPYLPGPGQTVTAGFAFDVPVRFDTDRIEVGISAFKAGRIPTVPLIEVLL